MKLTDKTLKRLTTEETPPEKNNRLYWDDDLKGFGVKITPKGAVCWFLNYYNEHGQERRITLGPWPEVNTTEARSKAADYRADIRRNNADPLEAKKERREGVTFNELCNEFMQDPEKLKLRPNTLRSYRGLIANDLRKALGKLPLKAITRADIAILHRKMHDRPYQANRLLALLSVMVSFAMHPDRAWIDKNLCTEIKRYPETRRKRYLKHAEVQRFYEALDDYAAKHHGTRYERTAKDSVNALRLLLLTGSRLNEVLQADWKEFDLEVVEAAAWRKPADRMKGGEESEIPLSQAAVDVLVGMGPKDHGPLFVGKKGRKPRVSLKRVWDYAKEHADLHNLRKHDLRHSFASFAISNGVPLAVLRGLSAHKQSVTTDRYAHMLDEPMRSGTNTVGNELTRRPA